MPPPSFRDPLASFAGACADPGDIFPRLPKTRVRLPDPVAQCGGVMKQAPRLQFKTEIFRKPARFLVFLDPIAIGERCEPSVDQPFTQVKSGATVASIS